MNTTFCIYEIDKWLKTLGYLEVSELGKTCIASLTIGKNIIVGSQIVYVNI
jgi:hypothetical protein